MSCCVRGDRIKSVPSIDQTARWQCWEPSNAHTSDGLEVGRNVNNHLLLFLPSKTKVCELLVLKHLHAYWYENRSIHALVGGSKEKVLERTKDLVPPHSLVPPVMGAATPPTTRLGERTCALHGCPFAVGDDSGAKCPTNIQSGRGTVCAWGPGDLSCTWNDPPVAHDGRLPRATRSAANNPAHRRVHPNPLKTGPGSSWTWLVF